MDLDQVIQLKSVWLLTVGDGSHGDEWNLLGIYATEAKAEAARTEYEKPRPRGDGSTYSYSANVEEWDVQ